MRQLTEPPWRRREREEKKQRLGKAKLLSTEFAEAQVMHWYPGLSLRSGWDRHTRDGTIPWKMFWLYFRLLPRISAAARLNHLEAISMAIANAMVNPNKERARAEELKTSVSEMRAFAQGAD